MATRVIIVRHGESTYNVQSRIQGHLDESVLTAAGRTGAQRVGQALQDIPIDAIYCSPLKRAQETASLIRAELVESGADLPLHMMEDLKEINLPPWEGLEFTEVEANFPEQYKIWRQEPHNLMLTVAPESGTAEFYPLRSLYDQARRLWQTILPQRPDQTIVLVGHSAVNRALISTALNIDISQFTSLHQANCGISILNFADGWGSAVQLESMNLTGHLGQPLPSARQGVNGLRILLVRHGETNWNRDKRFQGQRDIPLNDNGRVQARQAAEFLKDIPIDRAVSSPMSRPKETAEIILNFHPGVVLTTDDNLREISHGLWEGKLDTEIETEFPGELERWQSTPAVVQMPEGENLQDVWQRCAVAWQAIVDLSTELPSGSTVLVSAHDAVNKAILCQVVGLDPSYFWAFKQGNGAVSVIDYPHGNQGRGILRAANITSHLGGVLDKTAAGAL